METRLTLDHIAITVQDMERAVTFYRDVLGFEVLGQSAPNDAAFKLVYLRAGAGRIEVFAFAEQGRRAASDRNGGLRFHSSHARALGGQAGGRVAVSPSG